MSWYFNGSSIKSYADVDKLRPAFSTAREAERMDKNQPSTSKTSHQRQKNSHQRRPPTLNLCHSDLKADGSRAVYQYLYRAMDANSARKQTRHDL
jgi:hypothetical protein